MHTMNRRALVAGAAAALPAIAALPTAAAALTTRLVTARAIAARSPFPVRVDSPQRLADRAIEVSRPLGHRTRRNGDEDQREGDRLWP
jgi:hypothetical protein